jgi:hypothetical protein
VEVCLPKNLGPVVGKVTFETDADLCQIDEMAIAEKVTIEGRKG